MNRDRCPLCYAFTGNGPVEHLVRDHRRTYAEACVLFERGSGNLGMLCVGFSSEGSATREP